MQTGTGRPESSRNRNAFHWNAARQPICFASSLTRPAAPVNFAIVHNILSVRISEPHTPSRRGVSEGSFHTSDSFAFLNGLAAFAPWGRFLAAIIDEMLY